jgi:hypothetical protein
MCHGLAVSARAIEEGDNMADRKTVLMIGLHPDVVVYDRWPGLTAEKLRVGFARDARTLADAGYDAQMCFVDHGESAEATVRGKLAETRYDAILIGAGVRTDPEEFALFETLVNVAHEAAPGARLCFNTGPTDSVDAIRRWI